MGSIESKLAAKKMSKILRNSGKKGPKPGDTSGEVKRVEGNIAYVRFDGSEIDTPVNISHDVSVGDRIRVKVGDDHKAWTMGNISRPPTDDRVANVARRVASAASDTAVKAEEKAVEAENNSESALSSAEAAVNYSVEARQIAGKTNQYFWHKESVDPEAEDDETGAHITEVPQEEWEDPTSKNYHSGGNLLARSNGIAVRAGLTEIGTFGLGGITFLGLDGNNNLVPYFIARKDASLFRSRKAIGSGEVLKYFVTPQLDTEGFHIYLDRGSAIGSGLEGVKVTKDEIVLSGTYDDNQQHFYGNYIRLATGDGDGIELGYYDYSGDFTSHILLDAQYGRISTDGEYRGTLEEPTPSVTASVGVVNSVKANRFGQIVQMYLRVHKTAATAQGSNIFEGILDSSDLIPVLTSCGCGYYGTRNITGTITNTGSIVIRNCGESLPANTAVTVSFTYLVE